MTISKDKIEISTLNAKIALFATLIAVVGSIIGIGIGIGNTKTVDAQQTKDIGILYGKVENTPTKEDLRNYYEDMKGLLQTFISQKTNVQ